MKRIEGNMITLFHLIFRKRNYMLTSISCPCLNAFITVVTPPRGKATATTGE